MKDYFSIANGSLMFVLCGIVVLFVVIQSVLFMRRAWNQGVKLGIPKEQMRKSILSSMVFSIVPTLPILIVLLTLMPVLGNYFPWLRLSVVGSGAYENMAATVAANAFGLESFMDDGFNESVFICAMWVMTISIIWGNVFTTIGLKSLDIQMKKMRDKKPVLFSIIVNGMFLAMLAYFSAPHITNISNTSGIAAFVTAAIFSIIFTHLSKKLNNRTIAEFSFPVSMVLGMIATLLV